MPARACIAAMMKLERPYLVEWVAWHRLLGFEIVIADHGGDDGQSELLAKLDALGLINRIDVRSIQGDVQRPFYRLLFRWAQRNGLDYIGFFDGDEFFEPVMQDGVLAGSGAALVDRLFSENPAAALAFNWMIFGNSNLADPGPEPVMQRFSWAAGQQFDSNKWLKSFCHVRRCDAYFRRYLTAGHAIQAHTPNLPPEMILHDGQVFRPDAISAKSKDVSWQYARVRHYVIKTREEFRNRKINRGGFWTHYNEAFFNNHNRNDMHAPLPAHVLDRLRREIAGITASVDQHPEILVPVVPWLRVDQLRNRWHTRHYFKGYAHTVVHRWRRGFDRARARIEGARSGKGGG
jgi:hypothetical protein